MEWCGVLLRCCRGKLMTRIWSTGHFYELWPFVLSEEEWATMLNAVAQQDLLWAEEPLQQGSHCSLTQTQLLVGCWQAKEMAGSRGVGASGAHSQPVAQSRLLSMFPLAVIQYNLG